MVVSGGLFLRSGDMSGWISKTNKIKLCCNNNKNLQTICIKLLPQAYSTKEIDICFSLMESPDQFSEKDLPTWVTTGFKHIS